MKTKLYFLLLLAIPTVALAGAHTLNNAVSNGAAWSSTSAWSLSRIPQSEDSIVIPAGTTIIVDQSSNLNNVYLTIGGTLNFNQNNSLALDNISIVSILGTGMLTASHPTPNELLSIGGVNKYVGKNDVTVGGPSMSTSATSTSPSGFTVTPVTLPVIFGSFSANRTSNGPLQLIWDTTHEPENSHLEVQRSIDGSDWTSIGTVAAGGNSVADSYTYSDEAAPAGQTLYRILQVDLDGKSMYSKIVSAGAPANAQATIIATGRTV